VATASSADADGNATVDTKQAASANATAASGDDDVTADTKRAASANATATSAGDIANGAVRGGTQAESIAVGTTADPDDENIPVCKNCNLRSFRADANYCEDCGTAFEKIPVCTNCNLRSFRADANYCEDCGTAFHSDFCYWPRAKDVDVAPAATAFRKPSGNTAAAPSDGHIATDNTKQAASVNTVHYSAAANIPTRSAARKSKQSKEKPGKPYTVSLLLFTFQ